MILLQDLIRFLDSCSEQEMAQAGTRSVLGAEALLRWNSAEIGPIPPDEFIGLAEQSGLIESIGVFVLESGCRQFRDLVRSVGQPLSLAMNVSPQQFRRGDLPQLVARVPDKTGFAPERLKLEVTEGLLLGDQNQIKVSLHNLHDMGVKLSMDDFGTGYSSLRYLRNFNFDIIKNDRSFVAEMEQNPEDVALVTTAIAMAHGLSLVVIAGGVEKDAQLELLEAKGCNQAQGNLFSPALPLEQFRIWLRG